MAGRLNVPNLVVPLARAMQMLILVRLGDIERAEQTLAGLDERAWNAGTYESRRPYCCSPSTTRMRGSPCSPRSWTALRRWSGRAAIRAFLLEATAREALGEQAAADTALERALDLAEPDGWLLPFLLHPAPGLLERCARRRTAHAALIGEILGLLAGNRSAPPLHRAPAAG